MSRTVLFAGGPLHGKTQVIDDGAYAVYAQDYKPLDVVSLFSSAGDGCPPMPEGPVRYNLSRLAMCGRIVWVGHLGAVPDEDLAFEVLTSDGAKAASVPV